MRHPGPKGCGQWDRSSRAGPGEVARNPEPSKSTSRSRPSGGNVNRVARRGNAAPDTPTEYSMKAAARASRRRGRCAFRSTRAADTSRATARGRLALRRKRLPTRRRGLGSERLGLAYGWARGEGCAFGVGALGISLTCGGQSRCRHTRTDHQWTPTHPCGGT